MEKVLIAAGIDEDKQARLRGVKEAFLELGYNVKVFNYRKFRLDYLPISNYLWNQIFYSTVKIFKPDLLFVMKGEKILPGIINKIKTLGIKTANWTVDDVFGVHTPFLRIGNIAEYDYCFSFDRFYTKELEVRGLNAHYLPCASAHNFYKRINSLEKIYDLTFAGSYYKDRENLMRQLRDYKLRIWGPNWDKLDKNNVLYDNIQREPSYEDNYVRVLNQSKITLNLNHKQSIESTNFRTFEALSCGTFLLVDYKKELSNLFEIGKELICYHNVKELRELIDYYLENEEERKKVAKAGQKRVLKEHTLHHRIRKVVDIIEKG